MLTTSMRVIYYSHIGEIRSMCRVLRKEATGRLY